MIDRDEILQRFTDFFQNETIDPTVIFRFMKALNSLSDDDLCDAAQGLLGDKEIIIFRNSLPFL